MAVFVPGSSHTAWAQVTNPMSVGFDYVAELYLGVDRAASSGQQNFSLAAHETRDISFEVTMPGIEGDFPVYLDVFSGGMLVGAYQALEDVTIASDEWEYGLPVFSIEPSFASWFTVVASTTVVNNGSQSATRQVVYQSRRFLSGVWGEWMVAHAEEITLAPGQSAVFMLPAGPILLTYGYHYEVQVVDSIGDASPVITVIM